MMLSTIRGATGAALAALILAGGCATKGDLEAVQTRVVSLEQHRKQVRREMGEDMERQEKLHAMLTEAEQTLRKSGANLGLRLEHVEKDMPKLRGDNESLMVRMGRIEKDLELIKKELADRLGTTSFFLPPDLPTDRAGMWTAGEAAATQGKLRETQAIFELYEASFPDDPRAPEALWKIAAAMEAGGDTDEAIRFYQKVFDGYKDTEIAPRAVMRIAEIYVIKKNCDRAKGIYKFVADEYKGTSEGKEAKTRARNIRRECGK